MKCSNQISLTLFLLFLLSSSALCDIPVHCVKSQIQGTWIIRATKTSVRDDLYKFTCGHSLPSKESDAYLVKPNNSFNIEFKVDLSDTAEATLHIGNKKKKGTWTMVYNEGFDINLGKYSFFAFSKYERNNHSNPEIDTRWVSKCYSTLVGWYHIGPKQWGCFVATKEGENAEEVTNGEPKGKLLVVANTVKKMDDTRKNRFKSVNKKDNNNGKVLGNGPISQYQAMNNEESDILLDGMTNFIQTKETMFLSKDFKDHHIFVDRVKNLTDLWEATTYDEFSKMTLEELNKFAGRKKIGGVNIKKDIDMKKLFEKLHPEKGKVESAEMFKFRSIKRSAHRDARYPQFPKNYLSNKKFMHPARNQGSCGSCYVMATIAMLEARLRKQTNNRIRDKLSVQHVLDCSVYNQGCSGGYAYLVLKFGKEIELLPDSCMRYQSRDTSCDNRCDRSQLQRTYHVKDYKYIGGSYGQCSEIEIMKEVMKNGPVVVSFEPDYLFMHYRRGIYKSVGDTWLTRNEAKPQWVKVDHSVVLVGWGYDEDKQVPYWLLQNSWGKHWGEGGYFRMIRGIDHMGIESICEAGNIYFKDVNNSQEGGSS